MRLIGNMTIRGAAGLLLAGLVAAGPAAAFPAREKLLYDISWTGIKAGTAVQEVVREKGAIRISSTARSVEWVSRFFNVDDRIESHLTAQGETPLPLRFTMKISEGNTRRDREIVFDREKRSAFWIDHLNDNRQTVPVTPITYDTLSSFYFVRTQKLEPGTPVFVDILDNKKLWKTEVQVLRRERVKVPAGEFDTVVVKPLMKSEGIFNRKGEMYIWLTDDQRHVPVKMQSKVKIGSITAVLTGGSF
ncbi:MAG TPA: DUF3108 domain-containing protein [Verrucomicrobiae bacterium]|nr:DUF3108 domain-containing protein [Verrucomicrobiae bacterium]